MVEKVILIATIGGKSIPKEKDKLEFILRNERIKLGLNEHLVDKIILVPGKLFKDVLSDQKINPQKEEANPEELAHLLKTELEKKYGYVCDVESPVDPVNFKECLTQFLEIFHKLPGDKQKVVNITGGNRIVTSAALLAAWSKKSKVYYMQEVYDSERKEEKSEKKDVDLTMIDYLDPEIRQDSARMKIIKYLFDIQKEILDKHCSQLSEGQIESSLKQLIKEKKVDNSLLNRLKQTSINSLSFEKSTISDALTKLKMDNVVRCERSYFTTNICWLTDAGYTIGKFFQRSGGDEGINKP